MTISAQQEATLEHARRALAQGYTGQAAELAGKLAAEAPQLDAAHLVLGKALVRLGHLERGEAELREALRLAPDAAQTAVALSELLVATDRASEARAVLAPYIARTEADIFVLTAEAVALKSLRRFAEAAAVYERARDVTPKSAVAEHNLAGVYGDMQRFADSLDGVERAFAKGLDAPETWLVKARALQGLGRFEDAETAYREALRRRPSDADAHGELAQLIWMRTEDARAAAEPLMAALRGDPANLALVIKKAQLDEYSGNPRLAYAVLGEAPPAVRAAAPVEALAAQLASHFDPPRALAHARKAAAAAPDQHIVLAALCQAQLAIGDAEAAAGTALEMRRRWSLDQHAIALLATAWRIMGVPAYRELFDYQRFVRARPIETPDGWASRDAFVADLAASIERLHTLRTHPIGQSLRQGTQSPQGLLHSADPVVQAFFKAIDATIRRYISELKPTDGPLGARLGDGDYAFHGAWSVRLRPGGFHTDHVHQQGWISSACHLVTPASVDRGHEGWLKFGEPGVPTLPRLGAEHLVRPESGVLVLFPSYMWHGTVPFTGEDERLSIAFDLLPA